MTAGMTDRRTKAIFIVHSNMPPPSPPPMRMSLAVSAALTLLCARPVAALQIGPLLSTCIDSCRLGCREIRSVQQARDDGSSTMAVSFKDSDDATSALTEADTRAQAAIVGALRSEWGEELRIIGEEDDNADVASLLEGRTFDPLDRTLFDDELGETADLDAADFTIYVDPLDATREFVDGRLENCQVLVGIAIGDQAVAGVIGIPFPAGDLSTGETIVYGMADVGTGVVGEPLARGPFPLERNIDGIKFPRPHVASGRSQSPVMKSARDAVNRFGGSNVQYGGAGNKILAAALGEVSASIQDRYGGPWDVCAPEAIIKGFGGKITDLFGQDIAIYGPNAPRRGSERGYVAPPPSSDVPHDALIATLLSQSDVKQHREDLIGEDTGN